MKQLILISLFLLISVISAKSQMQSDTSDNYWSVVMPVPASTDIDLKQCLVSSTKDSIINAFISNIGSYMFRIDTIYFEGGDAAQFKMLNNYFPINIAVGASKSVEFLFIPTSAGIKNSTIKIITQSDTLTQNIQGEGVQPTITILSKYIDFGAIGVGNNKDSLNAITIKNTSNTIINVISTKHDKPNDYDFSTLATVANTNLNPGDTLKMNLRFSPSSIGRTSGMLDIFYNGVGSPAKNPAFRAGLRRRCQNS